MDIELSSALESSGVNTPTHTNRVLFLPVMNGTYRPKMLGVAWACSDTLLPIHSKCLSGSTASTAEMRKKIPPCLVALVAFLRQHAL